MTKIKVIRVKVSTFFLPNQPGKSELEAQESALQLPTGPRGFNLFTPYKGDREEEREREENELTQGAKERVTKG